VKRLAGGLLMLLGLMFLAPGTLVLTLHLFFYTVGWSPNWIPQLLIAMAVFGVASIIGGIKVSRLANEA
jgi:hypothetical protein